jgi:hypothetical protein
VIVKIRPPNQREMALPGGVIVNALEDGKTSEQVPFNSRSSFPPSTLRLRFKHSSSPRRVPAAFRMVQARLSLLQNPSRASEPIMRITHHCKLSRFASFDVLFSSACFPLDAHPWLCVLMPCLMSPLL